MKQRIISGVIMAAVVALALLLGLKLNNVIITVFVALVAAVAVWEFTFNALGIKWLPLQIIPMIYTAVIVWFVSKWLENALRMRDFFDDAGSVMQLETDKIYMPVIIAIITIFYFAIMAIFALIRHKDLNLEKMISMATMPLFIGFAFASLGSVITATNEIFYLLLILNFSSICDIGAYFVGVSLGKTKLCPEISPKKTVEGALGGMVASMIVGLIITLCFQRFDKILPVLAFTIPLCVAGIVGDLYASIIKRKLGIKDYGDLIPGHGGVLDRVDSILFIAPLVYAFMFIGIL